MACLFMSSFTHSEWLTAAEAAAYLKVANPTILEWAKTGRSPRIGYPGRCGSRGASAVTNSTML